MPTESAGDATRRDIPPRQRTAVIVSIIAALVAAGFVAAAAFTAAPPTLANLASSSSDGATATILEFDDTEAGVVVPRGWTIVRESPAAVTVRTPDGGLTARLEILEESADAAVRAAPDVTSSVRSEVLATGHEALHVDVAPDGVVAAVALTDAAAPVVWIEATPAGGSTMAAYRPALAELLQGIGP